MDIATVENAELEYPGISVDRVPGGEQKIHELYGLRIFRGERLSSCPPPAEKERPRCFEFYSLSHLIEGRGFYWEPGKPVEPMEAGDGVLISPGHVHQYGGDDTAYVEDCVCFEGPVADRLQRCGIIRNGVLRFGRARRVLPIIDQALTPAVNVQIEANLALQNLLVQIHLDRERQREIRAYDYITRLTEHLNHAYAEPWSIPRMAELCNLSPSRFRVVFHSVTGVAPKAYMDRLRIQLAAELLIKEDVPVAEVAERVGFQDPYHFSRRFKQLTGLAPRDYRRRMNPTPE